MRRLFDFFSLGHYDPDQELFLRNRAEVFCLRARLRELRGDSPWD